MPITIDLRHPTIATYFEPYGADPQQWRCKATGKVLQYAMLTYYRTNGALPLCGFSTLGLPVSNEIPIAGHAGVVKQFFERGVLVYDPSHVIDNPPGSGAVYPLHLYGNPSAPGTDPRLGPLQAQLADAQAHAGGTGATLVADMQHIREIASKY